MWAGLGAADPLLLESLRVVQLQQARFPLLVDPSGSAAGLVAAWKRLQAGGKGSAAAETSVLDPGFWKQLEAAARFGTLLVVRDAERADLALLHVLERGLPAFRAQARSAANVGGLTDVELSPSFELVLATRDAGFVLPESLLSRVCVVSFVPTQNSVRDAAQSLCLQLKVRAR
jgi:hypothetical protein